MGASLHCTSCEHDSTADSEPWIGTIDYELEQLMKMLFQLHDLNKDGVLAENELIQLNKKAAKLHYGTKVTSEDVTAKYRDLFRTYLDPEGKPVPYTTFRKYMLDVLVARDRDVQAQKMILEQLIAEAATARAAFHIPSYESASDAPFLATISFDEGILLGGSRLDQPRVPRLPSVAEEDIKTTSSTKRHSGAYNKQTSGDFNAVSPMSTEASTACSTNYQGVDVPAPQGGSDGVWQCSPMDFASAAMRIAREDGLDGLCTLCVDDRVKVSRQKVSGSRVGQQDFTTSWKPV